MLQFSIAAQEPAGRARCGLLSTNHGVVETPNFMPVGTYGAVKALGVEDLHSCGAQIILSNALHLAMRPGAKWLKEMGGLHRFMSWDRPILTDSGGFQLHSLSELITLNDEGALLRSPVDGSKHRFSPEIIADVQADLGVDVAMPLDSFSANPTDRNAARADLERTMAWLQRSMQRANERRLDMFGIVQGGIFESMRREAVERVSTLNVAGYAIGGLSVGEDKSTMWSMLKATTAVIPDNKARYLMGVGTPEDLVEGVWHGIDLFDCVLPTRNARNGMLFTSEGRLSIRNSQYQRDSRPIDELCGCFVCQTYSRAYIRYLLKSGEILGPRLSSYHNVYYYLTLMRSMREAIGEGQLSQWRRSFYQRRNSCEHELAL